jgi:hypothetical protein
VFRDPGAVLSQRKSEMVAVGRAVDTEHNFGKQKQIAITMTDRWPHFVAVISNQNHYWCRRSVACKRSSHHGESNFRAAKSEYTQWGADKN